MHSSRKGNRRLLGMKVHVGVGKDSGLVHSVATTAANVHEVTTAAALLHGEEVVLYGDAGYQGLERRGETRRELFPDRLEDVIPLDRLLEQIKPYYACADKRGCHIRWK